MKLSSGGIGSFMASISVSRRVTWFSTIRSGVHSRTLPRSGVARSAPRSRMARHFSSLPAVAIAFARNPMVCAYAANDLQLISEGRFILGLGSQIRPHIERRFSQTWSKPNARMREFVLAMRAIFRTWNEGEPLRFEGEFYRHTLMTPFLSPQPNPHGAGVAAAVTAVGAMPNVLCELGSLPPSRGASERLRQLASGL